MACIIIQEWAYSSGGRLGTDDEAVPLVSILTNFIESPPPATYTELSSTLDRLYADIQATLASFTDAKVPKASIPKLKRQDFSIATAQAALTTNFDALIKLVPKAGVKAVAGIQEKKAQMYASLGYYTVTKDRYDAQIGAAVASALLALQTVPDKHGPLVRAIMNAIKVCPLWIWLTAGRRIGDPPSPSSSCRRRFYILCPITVLEQAHQCARQGCPQPLHLHPL